MNRHRRNSRGMRYGEISNWLEGIPSLHGGDFLGNFSTKWPKHSGLGNIVKDSGLGISL